MKGYKVYTLSSSYKDGDPENIGVYESPRAMAAGLAKCVYSDHKSEKDKYKVVEKIALAVFDFTSMGEFESTEDSVCDENTVYGWEENEVEGLGDAGADAGAKDAIDNFLSSFVPTDVSTLARRSLEKLLENARSCGWINGHRCAQEESENG